MLTLNTKILGQSEATYNAVFKNTTRLIHLHTSELYIVNDTLVNVVFNKFHRAHPGAFSIFRRAS